MKSMKSMRRSIPILVVLLSAGLILGCGKKTAEKSSSETTTAHDHGAGEHQHGPGTHEHGAGVPVTPGNTSAEIFQQLADQESQLAAAIEAGRLNEVHQLAFNVRDLVQALAERAQGLSPSGKTRLEQAADSVAAIAERLDHFGDSGNLGATKEHFVALRAMLETIRGIEGLPAATLSASTTPPRAQAVSLAGEIVDPQCYFTHDSRGQEHAACAEMCARGGQGLSFLEEPSGKVYPLIAASHGKSQNEGLIEHLGKSVKVKGVAYNKGGNVALQIQSVEELR